MNELVTRQQETVLSISTETKERISITLLLGGNMHNKAILITRSICWLMIICTVVGCGPSTAEIMNSLEGESCIGIDPELGTAATSNLRW